MRKLTPEIGRGLFSISGEQLLMTPSASQLKAVASVPKVEYFTTLPDKPLVIETEVQPTQSGSLGSDSPFFRKFVVNPLAQKLQIDLGPLVHNGVAAVGIRGTACALEFPVEYRDINGPIDARVKEVKTVGNIVNQGGEKDTPDVSVVPFSLGGDGKIGSYALAYLQFYPRNFRFLVRIGRSMGEEQIFPFLLVYDPKHTRLDDFQAEASSESILKAYILDYPVY